MSARDNGGPAFPLPDSHRGMTLRDWFAGKALQGWLASFDAESPHPTLLGNGANATAQQAYALADAMIEARK